MDLSWLGGALQAGAALVGAGTNLSEQRRINQENKEMAYDFAHNSIRWKVDDALRAGIHPLAALGAGGYSAPVLAAGQADFEKVGQGLSQALAQTDKEVEEINKGILREDLMNRRLENEKLRREISGIGQTIPGPSNSSVSMPGSGVVASVDPATDNKMYVGEGRYLDFITRGADGGLFFSTDNELFQEGVMSALYHASRNFNYHFMEEMMPKVLAELKKRGLVKRHEKLTLEPTLLGLQYFVRPKVYYNRRYQRGDWFKKAVKQKTSGWEDKVNSAVKWLDKNFGRSP